MSAWASRSAICRVDCREFVDDAGRALREARRLGLRLDRDPARHDLGLLYAPRLRLGQAAHGREPRRGPPDADRGLLGPRQLRGVPPFEEVVFDAKGKPTCPEPTANYLPTCWRAGEIIEERCLAAGESAVVCRSARRARARSFVEAGNKAAPSRFPARRSPTGRTPGSVATASSRPSTIGRRAPSSTSWRSRAAKTPTARRCRFQLGFIGLERQPLRPAPAPATRRSPAPSSPSSASATSRDDPVAFQRKADGPARRARPLRFVAETATRAARALEMERQASFFMTGGLAAVHARAATATRSGKRSSGARSTARAVRASCSGSISLNRAADARASPMGGEVDDRRGPDLRGPRRRLLRAGCPAAPTMRRRPSIPSGSMRALQGRVLQPDAVAAADHAHRGRAHPPAERTGTSRSSALIEDPWRVIECDAERGRLRRTLRRRRFAAERPRRPLLCAGDRGAEPGGRRRPLGCERDEAGRCVAGRSLLRPAERRRLPRADRGARLVVADLRPPRELAPGRTRCGSGQGSHESSEEKRLAARAGEHPIDRGARARVEGAVVAAERFEAFRLIGEGRLDPRAGRRSSQSTRSRAAPRGLRRWRAGRAHRQRPISREQRAQRSRAIASRGEPFLRRLGSSPDRSSTPSAQAKTRGARSRVSAIGVGSKRASWVSWPYKPKSPAPGRPPSTKRVLRADALRGSPAVAAIARPRSRPRSSGLEPTTPSRADLPRRERLRRPLEASLGLLGAGPARQDRARLRDVGGVCPAVVEHRLGEPFVGVVLDQARREMRSAGSGGSDRARARKAYFEARGSAASSRPAPRARRRSSRMISWGRSGTRGLRQALRPRACPGGSRRGECADSGRRPQLAAVGGADRAQDSVFAQFRRPRRLGVTPVLSALG